MTKKVYRKLIIGHLQWSMIGLTIALFVAFIGSDYRSVVYGVSVAESEESEVSEILAPVAEPKGLLRVVPGTTNGKLVWPDPWDQIVTNF
jgi:hypothetical protein